MNNLLLLLSILIYTVYSQCGNNHAQQTLLSISINGPSVNKIGQTEYLNIIKSAADTLLPASSPNVAIRTFGGITVGSQAQGTGTLEVQALGGSTSTAVSSAIDGITNFDNNLGNVASAAMTDAISVLSGQSGQKYHVLFAAGNPLANGAGTTTQPINRDDPCVQARDAKKANIQTYVVLIGEQGINFVKEFYSCLVENPATDIIVITPSSTSAGLAALSTVLCKSNGIDVKITEVNPVDGGPGGYRPFIEILNRGAAISGARGCWGTTDTDCSNTATLGTGEYLIAYGSGSRTIPTVGDQIRGGLNGGGITASSWTATVQDGSNTYNTVTYSASTWQDPITGRSFELRGLGYNNQDATNWRTSCNPNVVGSPGNDPSDCTLQQNSCDTAVCDQNGDTVTGCNQPDINYCLCSSAYLQDGDNCIVFPKPTSCRAYIIYDPVTSKDWIYYAFDGVKYDGEVVYSLKYMINAAGQTKDSTSSFGTAAYAVSEFPDLGSITFAIDITSSFTPPLRGQASSDTTSLSCTSIKTQIPTVSPTKIPTLSPNSDPTGTPTKTPTFDSAGVYVGSAGGICGSNRCECVEEQRSCCTPFGIQFGTDLTNGYEPGLGCNHKFLNVQVPSGREEDYVQEIKVYLYPDEFYAATTIKYTITEYGEINLTDFENLRNWTDAYDRRRLLSSNSNNVMNVEQFMQNGRRKLLQNGSATPATPAPTTLFGNRLNIQVKPPGEGTTFTGTANIADGDAFGVIALNVTTASLTCNIGDDCVTREECTEQALGFGLNVSSCDITGQLCDIMYPHIIWISVTRSSELCVILYGEAAKEDELPDWFWWVLIALIIFLLILAWLVYRFWWRQKKTASELGDAEDELDQQQADNEAGFGKDLDVGDVAFNPMATGVPGMNRPADAFGNELHQRQLQQQNDMVDVQAEIFQVRQDYGQVQQGQRHHGGGGAGGGGQGGY